MQRLAFTARIQIQYPDGDLRRRNAGTAILERTHMKTNWRLWWPVVCCLVPLAHYWAPGRTDGKTTDRPQVLDVGGLVLRDKVGNVRRGSRLIPMVLPASRCLMRTITSALR